MPAPMFTVLGDSFAQGRGDPAPGGGYLGWVPRVAAALGIPPSRVRNLGEHGATTQTVVDRQLALATAAHSRLVGITVGGNDLVSDYSRSRFEDNLAAIFDALTVPGTVAFTITFPDIPGRLPIPPGLRDLLRERFDAANAYIRPLAARLGMPCFDLAHAPGTDDPSLWNPDGIHPSPRGYAAVAEGFVTLLRAGDAEGAPARGNSEAMVFGP
ncbi:MULTISPECIES: SGNH/GDSL hydrolase family protein [unclassified Pseudofrankia]|uniref:SGNH/GDSL hydrolase family protein n=1 Tax=unclassified Pseudofrankia TaxID=2994372 RepID=UPI0008D96B19|nr:MULTISPECIES: SGNH/GDSL hydrolase family protein [unclassified Pseudofrankia]MDT3439065.1 SGNH/GDSL hydrolase family protein [Pseudofrankia sp. BMG5.37]OHV45790.1 hypothetical protein BCD48_21775 [Pseudofrankia sp. BMG5.36]